MKNNPTSSIFLSRHQLISSIVFVLFLLSTFYFLLSTSLAHAANLIPCGGSGEPGAPANRPCTFQDLVTMGNNIINFLLYYLAAPIAVLMFMWAGFIFIFHSDNPGEISKAKGIFRNVVVGFVLALAAFLVIKLILLGLQVDTGLYKDVRG